MYTFPKKQHLCGDKSIECLHKNGKSFLVYPLRVVYLPVENEEIYVRVMVSVSKKRFKKAVQRNRIKRIMRESYRLNKLEINDFCVLHAIKLHVAFQYISTEMETFDLVNKKMKRALDKLKERLTDIADKNDENN